MVQSGLDRLQEAGELEISVASLGHRSSFVGAVLLTLPGTHLSRTSPPRILLADPATQYKLNQAGSINAWWSADPRQRFWLEITDRHDVGVDLHCPQRGSDGKRSFGILSYLVGQPRRHRVPLQPGRRRDHVPVVCVAGSAVRPRRQPFGGRTAAPPAAGSSSPCRSQAGTS